MTLDDYIIDHRGLDWSSLLRDWSWLLPTTLTVWIMNRFGDLFIVLDDGSVHWLDVGGGTMEKIAESREDFMVRIDQDENANQWLMIPLVGRLVAAGVKLGSGQCYSYKQPPVLGGEYAVENTCVLPITAHYAAYGSIHKQIKDLPNGTRLVLKVTE
jgi:hypothetical protein